MGGGTFADGFFGEKGLLADAVGGLREFALVGADGGEVIRLADEIERAEGFPDLFIAGVHSGDFGSGRHGGARGYGESADASGDGGAEFDGLLAILQLGDQAALMDGGSHLIRVRYAAGAGGYDFGRLQEGDNLGTAGRVSKADQRKSGIAADHRGRVLEHF